MSMAIAKDETDLTSITVSTLKSSAGFWFLVAGAGMWLVVHALSGGVLALAILGAMGIGGAALALWQTRGLRAVEQMRRALGGPGLLVRHR